MWGKRAEWLSKERMGHFRHPSKDNVPAFRGLLGVAFDVMDQVAFLSCLFEMHRARKLGPPLPHLFPRDLLP